MKIIKRAAVTPSIVIRCSRCKAELEVEKSDIKATYDDQRDGYSAQFLCPECNAKIYVGESVVPKDWRY